MDWCRECHKQVRGVLLVRMAQREDTGAASGGAVALRLVCPHDGAEISSLCMGLGELFDLLTVA